MREFASNFGEVPERPNGTVLKTVEVRASVGSNPTPSAKKCPSRFIWVGTFYMSGRFVLIFWSDRDHLGRHRPVAQ